MVLMALVAIWVGNIVRLQSARAVLDRAGPSERLIELELGFNAYCGGDLISARFWQRGPRIPERWGYICGGVISQAIIRPVGREVRLHFDADI